MSQARRQHFVRRRLLLDKSSWLFIAGTSNSGTTALTRILARHPAVRDLPKEGQFLTDALPRPDDLGHDRLWALHPDIYHRTEAHDAAAALRAKYDWSYHYDHRPGVLMEKSPPNLVRLRWLQANFQPSRFLILVRNPYAVCEGILRRRPDATIEQAAQQWIRAHEIMFDDLPCIERHLLVSYERLCDETRSTLREIEQFLEFTMPFENATIDQPMQLRPDDKTAAPLRNRNAEHIARLTAAQIDAITRIAGPMMQRLGYAPLTR